MVHMSNNSNISNLKTFHLLVKSGEVEMMCGWGALNASGARLQKNVAARAPKAQGLLRVLAGRKACSSNLKSYSSTDTLAQGLGSRLKRWAGSKRRRAFTDPSYRQCHGSKLTPCGLPAGKDSVYW